MGAAKKRPLYEEADMVGKHNGAANIMFSTNPKRAIAKKQNERVLRRKFEKKKPRLSTFRAIMIAFILGILCVGQYGIVQDMGLTINQKQSDLKEVIAANEALRQESAALSNKSAIQKKAEDQLGMQEAENVIVYTPSTPIAKKDANAQ
ncbi:MAG: hypothetical protein U0N74_08765 [Peptococcaceae bacterium]|nr:hypothetical protein [Peptococcaceae bacterium]